MPLRGMRLSERSPTQNSHIVQFFLHTVLEQEKAMPVCDRKNKNCGCLWMEETHEGAL